MRNMRVIIFGAGKRSLNFFESYKFLDYIDILFVIDNDEKKWGTTVEGYRIYSPDKVKTEIFDKIIVTTHFDEIKEQLISTYNISKEKITKPEYLIVPEFCNTGSIHLNCKNNELCDITQLKSEDIITSNPLEEFFFFGKHRIIYKWWHYFEIYNEYFQKYVGKPIKMLEIGVFKGGSLQMWRYYFGNDAVIVGIDIDSKCAKYEEDNTHVCIGSQDDPNFLRDVCEMYGPFDIVLDDGSHMVKHQITSFEILFPLLNNGGVYLCEDTHTSYWEIYGGELKGNNTFVEFAKSLVDELHYQHIRYGNDIAISFRNQIRAIHFYDSIIVFEKRKTGFSVDAMIENGDYV